MPHFHLASRTENMLTTSVMVWAGWADGRQADTRRRLLFIAQLHRKCPQCAHQHLTCTLACSGKTLGISYVGTLENKKKMFFSDVGSR